jgi:hypothetical protein
MDSPCRAQAGATEGQPQHQHIATKAGTKPGAHDRILQPRLPVKPQRKSPRVNSNGSTPRQLAMYSQLLKGKHNNLALHRQSPVY